MANGDVRAQIHDAFYGLLIDRIGQDRYPSSTMMDLVEQGMSEEQLGAYADVLLDKIASDRFPSMDMLRRLSRLA
jgi:hypothetical protein